MPVHLIHPQIDQRLIALWKLYLLRTTDGSLYQFVYYQYVNRKPA